jgi:DNA-binding transcriptional MerR regulator
MGPATRYHQGHLDRLRLIRHLQKEHQPLAEIRAQLEGLSDEQVRQLVASRPMSSPSSAADYVRSVLGRSTPPAMTRAATPSAREDFGAALLETTAPSPLHLGRSQWERIALAPDVELHVRRPLTREGNRRVERLLDLARTIFQEE